MEGSILKLYKERGLTMAGRCMYRCAIFCIYSPERWGHSFRCMYIWCTFHVNSVDVQFAMSNVTDHDFCWLHGGGRKNFKYSLFFCVYCVVFCWMEELIAVIMYPAELLLRPWRWWWMDIITMLDLELDRHQDHQQILFTKFGHKFLSVDMYESSILILR